MQSAASTTAERPERSAGFRGPRVCVVGAGSRFLSGISYYTHRLSLALSEQHEVSVILMRQLLPTRLYPGRDRVGQPLARLDYPRQTPAFDGVDWFWGPSIVRAGLALMRAKPDVVVFQWWTGTVLHSYLALAALARLRRARVVIEFHESLDTGELRIAWAQAYVRLLSPLMIRFAHGFVVHSEHDRAAIGEHYRLGDRPVVVIPHGPFRQYHDLAPAPSTGESPLSEPINLLFFGVIRPFKGVEDLIEAFDGLSDAEAAQFRLTVVGETWEEWTLPAELIAQSRRRDRITFVNRYVTDEEVAGFFAEADAVVLPYHRSSASGPLHVTMSHGLPVIVTQVGGLTEAAGTYEGALFVPPKDPAAIRDAIRQVTALRGQRFADPHSWDRTVESYDRLFQTLLPAMPPASAAAAAERTHETSGAQELFVTQKGRHMNARTEAAGAPKTGSAQSKSAVAEPNVEGFEPIRIMEVEIGRPLPFIAAIDPATDRRYTSALVLVRLHGEPLGIIDVPIGPNGVDPDASADAIWRELAAPIGDHLRRDGLPAIAELDGTGIATDGTPACALDRERFLRRAPFLSVIIPTRDRPERLERCLRSIKATEYPTAAVEVVVVDNNPATMETFELIRRLAKEWPQLRYLREDQSGSASARNAGLSVVTGEFVVFTDDDVVVDAHWLTEIARAFESTSDVACVSGLLLPMELETPAQVWFEQYGGFSRGFEHRIYDLGEHRLPAPLYPYTAGVFGTGNNMAFRRSVLYEIGEFDPALGNGTPALGGVDSEVLLRTIIKGHRIVYEPRAFVYHLHRRDYAGLHRQIYSYGVGLTAYMLKTLLANPRLIPDFALKLPRGLFFALDPRSEKNSRKRVDYPKELTWLELRGMLYGPLAYFRSRRAFGPHRVEASPRRGLQQRPRWTA